jgi:hypothetical protein
MSIFYFVGSHSTISGPNYDYALTKFGETVTLDDAAAENHAAHGARLVPAADFDAIGFTPEELEMNSDLLAHDLTAEEDFLHKRTAAFEAADQFRAKALAALATKQE